MEDQVSVEFLNDFELLKSGIPTIKAYEHLSETKLYLKMKSFSNEFANRYQIGDAFRHWSRKWEYSYAFSQISRYISTNTNGLRIMDAGSAIRFFPFFVSETQKNTQLMCCDIQPGLETEFARINHQISKEVHYTETDLRNQPFDDNSFDIIYCISVLEHTENYEVIVKEFKRLLKPGGLLILTFDIALSSGKVEGLHPLEAKTLQNTICQYFHPETHLRLGSQLKKNILTTKHFDKKELPWRRTAKDALIPTLKHFLNFKKNPWRQTVNYTLIPALKHVREFWKTPPLPSFMYLTIFCETYTNEPK